MDPLITNGVDPALLRVLEKRGHERDAEQRRRRPALPPQKSDDEEIEPALDAPEHEIDDLA